MEQREKYWSLNAVLLSERPDFLEAEKAIPLITPQKRPHERDFWEYGHLLRNSDQ
jgi:hypothetical protein